MSRIESIESINREVTWEFNNLKDQLNQKVNLDTLIVMESKFNEYTPLTEYDILKYNMKNYIQQDDFDILRAKLDELIKSSKNLASADAVTKEIKSIKSEIESNSLDKVK